MQFDIFDIRMKRVDFVDATDVHDALTYAKRIYPGASVEKVTQQQRQRAAEAEVELWKAMRR